MNWDRTRDVITVAIIPDSMITESSGWARLQTYQCRVLVRLRLSSLTVHHTAMTRDTERVFLYGA
jgi:hypothetical protein